MLLIPLNFLSLRINCQTLLCRYWFLLQFCFGFGNSASSFDVVWAQKCHLLMWIITVRELYSCLFMFEWNLMPRIYGPNVCCHWKPFCMNKYFIKSTKYCQSTGLKCSLVSQHECIYIIIGYLEKETKLLYGFWFKNIAIKSPQTNVLIKEKKYTYFLYHKTTPKVAYKCESHEV